MSAAELWVSPTGSDSNPGTQVKPLASLAATQQKMRSLRRQARAANDEPFKITLGGGKYTLTTPLCLRQEDSGTKSDLVMITAAPGEQVEFSGGVEIRGWKKLPDGFSGLPGIARGKVWVASAPRRDGQVLNFRQLWVDNLKAVRARTPNAGNLTHLVAWDKTNQVATIPGAALAGARQLTDLEMVVDQVWEIAVLRFKAVRIKGTNAFITFRQPESDLEFSHPWPPVIVSTNYCAPFFLANAMQFLDSPGEWFEDLRAGKIYYWPRAGEDLSRATIVAPVLETLVQIEGSPDQPVSDIRFQNIIFSHTTWLRPSEQGHVPLQAGMFLLAAKKLSPKGVPYAPKLDNLAWIGRPPAAVTVENTKNISFENCTFEHLAATGLDFIGGTSGNLVQGCTFRDIGGNGLQLGEFSRTNVETHLPFDPSDPRVICNHETIADSYFSDCGAEDWGCMGICVGYARNITIRNNEIRRMPYSGLSVGWGWTKHPNAARDNLIVANHIHHVGQILGDLGGIYTLSAQPGTVIAENYIHDLAPIPFVPDTNHWFYLYLDEGSSGITVRDNWCPSEKFLKNANGPGNVWTNNGPQVSEQIKAAAGPKF